MASLLEIEEISVYYGNIQALDRVSLSVEKGQLVALIGANGAGKSTLLRTISGLLHPQQGRILFQGRDISRLPAERIVGLGIAHCPEERQLFPDMSVQENLEMGAYLQPRVSEADLEAVYQLFPVLRERRRQKAGSLSGGEQQMLAIGRALMSRPKLLLFDEPSLGLAPNLVEHLARTIQTLNRRGLTILLVEQNTQVAFAIAHRGYVLENGRIVLSGDIPTLRANPMVKKAYLGI